MATIKMGGIPFVGAQMVTRSFPGICQAHQLGGNGGKFASDLDPDKALQVVGQGGAGVISEGSPLTSQSTQELKIRTILDAKGLPIQKGTPPESRERLRLAVARYFPGLENEFENLFSTPQGSRFHAEGPTVRDHLAVVLDTISGVLGEEIRGDHLDPILECLNLATSDKTLGPIVSDLTARAKKLGKDTVIEWLLVHDLGKGERLQLRSPDNPLLLFEVISALDPEVRSQIRLQGKPMKAEESERPTPITAEDYYQKLVPLSNEDRLKELKEIGHLNISNADFQRILKSQSPEEAQAKAERLGFVISYLGHDWITEKILHRWAEKGKLDPKKAAELSELLGEYGAAEFEKVDARKVQKWIPEIRELNPEMKSVEEAIAFLESLTVIHFFDHLGSYSGEKGRPEIIGTATLYISIQNYRRIHAIEEEWKSAGLSIEKEAAFKALYNSQDLITDSHPQVQTLKAQYQRAMKIPASLNDAELAEIREALQQVDGLSADLAARLVTRLSQSPRDWNEWIGKEFGKALRENLAQVKAAIEKAFDKIIGHRQTVMLVGEEGSSS